MGAGLYPSFIIIWSAAACQYFCKIIGPDYYTQEIAITLRMLAAGPLKPTPLSVAIPQKARRVNER